MAIHSAECTELNMSSWVAEKADHTLEAACKLVEWFRERKSVLSRTDRDEAQSLLMTIIGDSAKLAAFGHENMDCYTAEWVDLMLCQGSDRYVEFRQRLSRQVPNATPPLNRLRPSEIILGTLDELHVLLKSDIDDISLARHEILQQARFLLQTANPVAHGVGNRLLDLVDEQVVYARITWPELVAECIDMIEQGHADFLEQAQDIPAEAHEWPETKL